MAIETWDEYWMLQSQHASIRTGCESRGVGAVIVKDNMLLSQGYNGPAKGVKHCIEKFGGCPRRQMPDYKSGMYLDMCQAAHAEANAIAFAAKFGNSINGATIYVNTFPCKNCMIQIINSGISKIVYNDDYNSEMSKKIAEEAKIELVKYSGRPLEELFYIELESYLGKGFNDFIDKKQKERVKK